MRHETRRVACLALAAAIAPVASRAGAQISPGPLSAAHASLDGPLNCAKCHAGGKESMTSRCLTCHREITWLADRNRGFHARRLLELSSRPRGERLCAHQMARRQRCAIRSCARGLGAGWQTRVPGVCEMPHGLAAQIPGGRVGAKAHDSRRLDWTRDQLRFVPPRRSQVVARADM